MLLGSNTKIVVKRYIDIPVTVARVFMPPP